MFIIVLMMYNRVLWLFLYFWMSVLYLPYFVFASAFSAVNTAVHHFFFFCINKAIANNEIYVFLSPFSASGKTTSWSSAEDERPNLSSRRHHGGTLISALPASHSSSAASSLLLCACCACAGSLWGPREFSCVTRSASIMCEALGACRSECAHTGWGG